METDRCKPVQIGVQYQRGDEWDDTYRSHKLGLTFQPRSSVEVPAVPALSRTDKVSRWVTRLPDTDGRRIDVVGELDREQSDIMLKGMATFSPYVSIQLYGQPLI